MIVEQLALTYRVMISNGFEFGLIEVNVAALQSSEETTLVDTTAPERIKVLQVLNDPDSFLHHLENAE